MVYENTKCSNYSDLMENTENSRGMREEQKLKRISDRVYREITETITRMNNSRRISYTRKYVKATKYSGFSVECERDDAEDKEDYGRVLIIAIYYQENGEDIDCCTLYGFKDDEDIRFFIRMWIK